jgi:hypothetical protein
LNIVYLSADLGWHERLRGPSAAVWRDGFIGADKPCVEFIYVVASIRCNIRLTVT